MKKKATTRKVTVRNGRFAAVVRDAVAVRTGSHARMVEDAHSSGIIEKLIDANKKNPASR
jgi:hypothetical protein